VDGIALLTAGDSSGFFRGFDQRLGRLEPDAAYEMVRRLYNEVSQALDGRLALEDADLCQRVAGRWLRHGAGHHRRGCRGVAAGKDGNAAAALVVQRALLRGCRPAAREFYRDRLLDVVATPRGRLAPDFLLDGRRHTPPVDLPNLLVVEAKYLAAWQCPRAENLFGQPAGFGYDTGLIFGAGHGTRAGLREPHRWGDLPHCDDYWHSPMGAGLYIASAIQLDIYLAFIRPVLSALGLDEVARTPELRPHGLLMDAWQRRVDDWLAVTHDRWSTTGFSHLLVPVPSYYETLRRAEPNAGITHRMGVLLGRLLYL
jgi:hypothetical protein